jgi:CHASE1-domain containing sensor protein
MKLTNKKENQSFSSARRKFLLLLTSGICLFLSITAFSTVLSREKARFEFDFEQQARNQANRIEETFNEYQIAVQFIGNFLEHTDGCLSKRIQGIRRESFGNLPRDAGCLMESESAE